MTDSVGLKNMVTVAAACLSNGWGILIGDNNDRALLAGNKGDGMGPIGNKGGNIEKENGLKKGIGKRKGWEVPPFCVYYIIGKLNVVTNALKTVGKLFVKTAIPLARSAGSIRFKIPVKGAAVVTVGIVIGVGVFAALKVGSTITGEAGSTGGNRSPRYPIAYKGRGFMNTDAIPHGAKTGKGGVV